MLSHYIETDTSWLSSFRKIFPNSCSIGRRISTVEGDLSRFAPAKLLLSLSVMDNFLEILQEFKENSFQYKKQLQKIVSQSYKSRRYVFGGGITSSFF